MLSVKISLVSEAGQDQAGRRRNGLLAKPSYFTWNFYSPSARVVGEFLGKVRVNAGLMEFAAGAGAVDPVASRDDRSEKRKIKTPS